MTTGREIADLLAEHRAALHESLCVGLGWNWPEVPEERIPGSDALVDDVLDGMMPAIATVIAAHTATTVNAAVEAAAVRVEALCEHPPALRGACFACFAAARAVRGDS